MKGVAVRRKVDNRLLCFGPDDGMYEPGYDPVTMVKALEPSYAALQQEWVDSQPPPIDLKATLRKAKTLPDLIAALEALL